MGRQKKRDKQKKRQSKHVAKRKDVDKEYDSTVAVHASKGHTIESSSASQHERSETTTCTKLDANFESKYGGLYHQFQSVDPNLRFSRLGGSTLRGSTRILCKTSRTAFLLLWSVFRTEVGGGETRISFDIQIAPVVNCSSLENASVHKISKQLSEELLNKFFQEFEVKGGLPKKVNEDEHNMFFNLTRWVMSKYSTEIVDILSSRMDPLERSESKSKRADTLKRAFDKPSFGISMASDHFDSFEHVDAEELGVVCGDSTRVASSTQCMVCFDDFEGNALGLSACGHRACTSCWRGLVGSAASSGDLKVRCPAYKCKNTLSFRDCAHILFDQDLQRDTDEYETTNCHPLTNLVSYRIDKHLLKNASRHCTTPACNGIFKLKKYSNECETSVEGSRAAMCSCGASICLDCGERSHVGTSCSTYKRVRKDILSGKLDNETRSMKWICSNTTPCPKCSGRINKNGGCNHLRCGNCKYVFCWICGGPGENCGAYHCKGRGINTYLGNTDNDGYSATGELEKSLLQQQLLAKHIKTEDTLNTLCRDSTIGEKDLHFVQKIKVLQTMSWASTKLLSKFGSPQTAKDTATHHNIEKLKNILAMFDAKDSPRVSQREMEIALISPYQRITPRNIGKKHLSKQARQALEKENGKDHITNKFSAESVIHSAIAQSLEKSAANLYIDKTVDAMFQKIIPAPKPAAQKDESSDQYRVCPLNQKARPLKASWKNSSQRRLEDDSDAEEDEVILAEATNSRWKGKNVVKVRRIHAFTEYPAYQTRDNSF